MIGKTNVGGGSNNKVNLRIVGGTSRPQNAKENTIWINTSTDITDVIITNVNDVPSSTPVGGALRIVTAVNSENPIVISDNPSITIYPIRAFIYSLGSWSDVHAETYQNGVWKSWSKVIFTLGDPMPTIAGSGGSVSMLDNGAIRFSSSADYATNRYITLGDLTNYRTLLFRGIGQRSGTTTDETVGICTATGSTRLQSSRAYPATNEDGITTDRTFDITSYVGEHRIAFYAYKGVRHIDMYHVELIP